MDFILKSPIHVKAEGLSKAFEGRSVLKNISIEVAPKEIFVLMGPSGSGKSVFLKLLMGLEVPDEGAIFFDAIERSEAAHKRVLAMVFQSGALFNSLSVFDNLAFYAREHRLWDEITLREKVQHTLKLLSIQDTALMSPAQLSGGMKKRVAIARALMMEPELLVYDEPTSELDPETAASIAEIIATLREEIGVTSIVVSHDKAMALSIADRIGILMDGHLQLVGTPNAIEQSDLPRVKSFLNPVIDIHHPRFKNI
jgi:phospholipid/cholesterol/gamma-HCH transport system ATP-binding protein